MRLHHGNPIKRYGITELHIHNRVNKSLNECYFNNIVNLIKTNVGALVRGLLCAIQIPFGSFTSRRTVGCGRTDRQTDRQLDWWLERERVREKRIFEAAFYKLRLTSDD